jgi:hypothetical protein
VASNIRTSKDRTVFGHTDISTKTYDNVSLNFILLWFLTYKKELRILVMVY